MSKRIKSIPLNICSKFYNSIPGNFFILSLFQTGVCLHGINADIFMNFHHAVREEII